MTMTLKEAIAQIKRDEGFGDFEVVPDNTDIVAQSLSTESLYVTEIVARCGLTRAQTVTALKRLERQGRAKRQRWPGMHGELWTVEG